MPKISYFKCFWVIFAFMNGLLSIILYCFQKQRKELGCSGSFSHDDSVYNEMSRVPWFMQQRFWGLCKRCPFSELTRDAVWCSFILGSSFHGVLGKNYDQYICLAHRKSLLWTSFFPPHHLNEESLRFLVKIIFASLFIPFHWRNFLSFMTFPWSRCSHLQDRLPSFVNITVPKGVYNRSGGEESAETYFIYNANFVCYLNKENMSAHMPVTRLSISSTVLY